MTTTNARPRFAKAHRQSVTYSIADVASYLQTQLGQKLVARIAGVQDAKTVGRWARGDHGPSSASETRLRTAFQVFVLLNQEENDHTVRAWFIGINPQLGDVAPAIALSEDKHADVLIAARAYLAGG